MVSITGTNSYSLRFQHQESQQAAALNLQHDGIAGFDLAQVLLEGGQVLNWRAVEGMNDVAGLRALAQQRAGRGSRRHEYSAWNPRLAHRILQLAVDGDGHNTEPVHDVVRPSHQIGEALRIVRPLDDRHSDRGYLPVAQNADLGLLSDLIGVEVERELANVVHGLVGDAGDDLADLQAGLVGRRAGNYVFDQHAAVDGQMQSVGKFRRDGAQINA